MFASVKKQVASDLSGFCALFSGKAAPKPGLYAYKVTNGKAFKPVHLRIHEDRSAVLFLDVAETISLNSSAAKIAKLALDGAPRENTYRLLSRETPAPQYAQLREDIDSVYSLLGALANSKLCEPLPEFLKRAAHGRAPQAPYRADIALTYSCNNRCSHCYNESSRRSMPSLCKSQWYKVVDTLLDIGIPHLIFTGGEPTLNPFLPSLIARAYKRGAVVGLNTNGRLLAETKFVEKLEQCGLNHVQITLESCESLIHEQMTSCISFSETVAGIREALKSRLHVITNTTLTKANCLDIEKTIIFLHSLGIRTFAANGMIHSGCGTAHPDSLSEAELKQVLLRIRDQAKSLDMNFLWYTPTEYCLLSPEELGLGRKRCTAAEYSICIEPNGDVLPCQSFYQTAGNILSDPWEKIWQSPLFLSLRNRTQDAYLSSLDQKCLDCPELDDCAGGCRLPKALASRLLTINPRKEFRSEHKNAA
jgi:radical SAM protein with 4Fe4S-binding SPASM domain